MNCTNCGVKLEKNSKYCPRCGKLFESNDIEKYSNLYNTNLLSIYFPENSIGIHINRISIWFLLFGPFYTIYKKLYKETIINYLSLILFCFMYFCGLNYILSFYGFFFYFIFFLTLTPVVVYIYYVFKINDVLIAKKKYRLNILLKKYDSKTEDEKIKIIVEDAKGNIKGVIILIFITILIISFIII